jgi:hypothetical protein
LVSIAPSGVGLPNLDHGVGDRSASAVKHVAFDTNMFAARLSLHKHIPPCVLTEQAVKEKRSYCL